MFWSECLRLLSCGLFGKQEKSDLELAPVNSRVHAEVRYTFAIQDSTSSDEAFSPERSDCSFDCDDFVSPGSESSSGSPWEVLEDIVNGF